MPQKEKVSYEEKRRIVLACINEKMGVCEAARIARVDNSSVRAWIKRYEAGGVDYVC